MFWTEDKNKIHCFLLSAPIFKFFFSFKKIYVYSFFISLIHSFFFKKILKKSAFIIIIIIIIIIANLLYMTLHISYCYVTS